MSVAPHRLIGRSLERLEDRPLLLGRGRFAADVSFAGQLVMRVVRSTCAHAKLLRIDVSAACALEGVHAVWTAADTRGIPPIDIRLTRTPGLEVYRQSVLASEEVRYVGEPVAAVFAEDAYLAEDAADLITVEVEDLPVVLAAEAEPREFLPGLSTEATCLRKGYGDIEAAFAAAHAIVCLDLAIGRHSAVPIETRGAIARYDTARDMLELYGAAKVPHWNRDQIARMLGRDPASVQLYQGHVGGGFGVRGELYPEDVLVCAASLRLRRPVKWIEDRHEHLIAANHSREQHHHVRAAIDGNGRILAIDDEFFHDQGAYMRTHGATVPDLAAAMLGGPYRVPAYRVEGHIRLTNKTPAGTYRAPGRFETTFVRERLLDAIAHRIGIDRLEVRRRNLIARSEMPYARPLDVLGTHVVLDSGDYAGLLDTALERIGWARLNTELAARRAAGELVGAGVAMFVEKSGLGPFEDVEITVDSQGDVEVVTGAASLGQGIETVIAQICGETLGVDYRAVRVIHGQTARIARGLGAFASRATVMTGEATRLAAEKLRATALQAAAALMQQPLATLDLVDGAIVSTAEVGPTMRLGALAAALMASGASLGFPEGLCARASFKTDHMTYPYGVHIAVLRVDAETGEVTLDRFLLAYDVGRAVNPRLVEGQLAGGFAQGLGGALLEEFCYDERGQPVTVTLADYLMPTAHEVPMLEIVITQDAPSPLNPLGLKGAGEGGANAVGAAIAAAIDDAIGRPGAVTRLPVTPQRLRAILADIALEHRAAAGSLSC
jgi:aerobic carbon-monoxide dehydrogenase large subunit